MEKIVKILLIFWGIVLAIVLIRYVLVNVDLDKVIPEIENVTNTITTEAKSYLDESPKNNDKENDKVSRITFPLEKNMQMVLNQTKSCRKNNSSHFEPKYLNTSSHCFNGDCTLSVSFQNDIPQRVGLYVQEGTECIEKYFEVNPSLQLVGYRVDLKLDAAQKAILGINFGDTVRLSQAVEYSLNSEHQHYFYDYTLSSDDIIVNGEKKGKVYFSQDKPKTVSKDNITESKVSPVIPVLKQARSLKHFDDDFFIYNCPNETTCTKTAKDFLLHEDGLTIIIDGDFIEKCQKSSSNHTPMNPYCNKIIAPGESETFQAPKRMIKHLYNNGSNPPDSPHLQKRIEMVKQKIYNK